MMYILPSEEDDELDALLEGAAAGGDEEDGAGEGLLPLPMPDDEGLGELPVDPEEEEVELPCSQSATILIKRRPGTHASISGS